MSIQQRRSIETIRDICRKDGFIFMSDEFKSVNHNIELKCKNNHIWTTTIGNLKKKKRKGKCPRCIGTCRKLTIDDVKLICDELGFTLLSQSFVNAHAHLQIISNNCPEKHICNINLNNLQNRKDDRSCPVCQKKTKTTVDEVRNFCKTIGYTCLSNECGGYYKKLDIICNKGHKTKTSWGLLVGGKRCSECKRDKLKKHIDDIRVLCIKRGFELLSTQYDARQKLEMKCPEGHVFNIWWNNFRAGNGCIKCSISKSEMFCRLIVETMFGVKFDNVKPPFLRRRLGNKCGRMELDIFNVDLGLAFEYQGGQHYRVLWYNNDLEAQHKRDKLKADLCKQNDITLIPIPELNRHIKPEMIQRFIIDQLKDTPYAQMINRKEIDVDIIRGFVNSGCVHLPELGG